MATPSSLIRVKPEMLAAVIISTSMFLFIIAVLGIIYITNEKNKELVGYELKIILEGNGSSIKNESKREFIQKMSFKDDEYHITISEINKSEIFESGNKIIKENGQCTSEKFFEYDINFCRPKPVPWDFLKIISFCFAIILFVSVYILKLLSFEMVQSFKKLFSIAHIPYSDSISFSSAWNLAGEMADRFSAYQKNEIEIEKNKAIYNISKQVAHDIRSPISALNFAVSSILKTLPPENKSIINNAINRINQIADDLLKNNKSTNINKSIILSENKNYLHELIENVLAEKRAQGLFHKIKISMELEKKNQYTKIRNADFSRLFSNLVNNSIESIDLSGEIEIHLRYTEEFAVVSIIDSGKGIPEYILEKLGYEEISYGKTNSTESGNGIGIFNAKKIIESIDGIFLINSKIGLGTKIEIKIPTY